MGNNRCQCNRVLLQSESFTSNAFKPFRFYASLITWIFTEAVYLNVPKLRYLSTGV